MQPHLSHHRHAVVPQSRHASCVHPCARAPQVLLEIHEALCQRLPLVCVNVNGREYDFNAARTFLDPKTFEANLEAANPGALEELRMWMPAGLKPIQLARRLHL